MLLRLFPYRPSSWAGTRSGDTKAWEAGIGLQRKETGNRFRDLFSLVCRITAALGRLGSWLLTTVPKHLMAINLFFLRMSPVGAQCCYPLLHYFANEQQREAVSPAGSVCSPSLLPWPVQCWGKAGVVSYHPWEENREVRGAEHKA